MESKQWAIKHRPTRMKDLVVGNRDMLELASGLGDTTQALLISGVSGTGKTTLARILARELNGDEWETDLIEMDLATDRGIDNIRGLKDRLQYKPRGNKIVVILDEVQDAAPQAKSSLLKLMEDPPHRDILIILCTDQPWKLSKPMLNRCRNLNIEPPTPTDLAKYLVGVAKKEKIKASPKTLKQVAIKIAKASNGIPRLAIQMLQDACALLSKGRDPKEAIRVVASGDEQEINRLVGSILIALYSKGSAEKASEFILTKGSTVDGMGLLIRLQAANYYGSIMQRGGKFNWQGKLYLEALKSRDLKPSIKDTLTVATRLNRIREELREVITDPTILVVTELAQLPFSMEK